MARPIALLVVLGLFVLPGCLSAVTEEAASPVQGETAAAPAPAAEEDPGFLHGLGLPGPAHWTRVSTGAEPWILVHKPTGYVFVGDTSGVYRSTNNGVSWTRTTPQKAPFIFGDGWALAQDDVGRIYASTTNGPVVNVAVSTNAGTSWSVTGIVTQVDGIADRPWLAARGDGEVVLVVNSNGLRETCAYSNDGGATFLVRDVLGGVPNAGNVVLDSQGLPHFAIDGQVWQWTDPCMPRSSWSMSIPRQGAQILTQMGIDDQDRLYVAQPSTTNGAMQIVGYNAFKGTTSKVLTVSPPGLLSNTFGAISVQGDEIAIAWYGSTSAGNPSANGFSGSWHVYLARVTDFWGATPQIDVTQVSDVYNHVGGFCMNGIGCTSGDRDLLDYFGVTHDEAGNVHVAYGHDGSGSSTQVRYARVNA